MPFPCGTAQANFAGGAAGNGGSAGPVVVVGGIAGAVVGASVVAGTLVVVVVHAVVVDVVVDLGATAAIRRSATKGDDAVDEPEMATNRATTTTATTARWRESNLSMRDCDEELREP